MSILAADVNPWYGIIPGMTGVIVAALATYSARSRDIVTARVAAETARIKAEADAMAADQARRAQDLATLNAGIDFLTSQLAEERQARRECDQRERQKDRRMTYLEHKLDQAGISYDPS